MQNFKLNEEFLLNNQDWTFPTFTAYGPGRFKEIGKFCKNFKINNALIVTDSGSVNLPFISDLQNLLNDSKIKSDIYSNISPNPRDDEIDSGCKKFREGNHDAIIAIGGGSAMDGGKAISLTVDSGVPLWDFEFEKEPPKLTMENPFPKIRRPEQLFFFSFRQPFLFRYNPLFFL